MGIKTTQNCMLISKTLRKMRKFCQKSYFQSSELGTSQPLTPRRVCPPPFGSGGGDTLACGWGGTKRRGHARLRVMGCTLIKKKMKFSSYIRKFRGIGCKVIYAWLTNPHIWWKYLCISSYIRKPFLIYDFAPDPIWISLYMMKILFSFLSV